MGFRYEDAASQWWDRWALSAKAPNSNSIEMKCLTDETLSRFTLWRVKSAKPPPSNCSAQARMQD